MILETMTPKEMMAEMHKDDKELHELNIRFLSKGGIKHLRRQGAKFPAYVMIEQHTKRGNRYLCDFLFRKRGDVFNFNGLESRMCLMQTKEGLAGTALVYSGKFNREALYIYRPHVFKRYKERMHLELDGIELIRYFDKRNCDTIFHDGYRHKEGDIENDIMLTVQDGALFGTLSEVDDTICYTLNTFIANDTMQEGYKSKFNSMHNQAVDEIRENLAFFGGGDTAYQFDFKKRKEDNGKESN